jgi:hypothetical protein
MASVIWPVAMSLSMHTPTSAIIRARFQQRVQLIWRRWFFTKPFRRRSCSAPTIGRELDHFVGSSGRRAESASFSHSAAFCGP